jgi:hypothetical protein
LIWVQSELMRFHVPFYSGCTPKKNCFDHFSARPEGWKELHTSDILEECENCFTYSQEDICGHRTSDHNFYAVCMFLSRSLWMRNTPEEVRRTHPQLEQMLRECAEPQLEQGRYKAVHKLIPLLANITRI